MEPGLPVIGVALAISMLSCVLSLTGGILIIISYVKIPSVRNTVRRLLLCLTIADMLTAFGNFVGAVRYSILYEVKFGNISVFPDDPVCTGQAFLTTFSNASSFMWTIMIAAHLFLAVILGRNLHTSNRVLVRFINHGLGWVVPGIMSSITLAKGKFGEDGTLTTGAWCWISRDIPEKEQTYWMYGTGKAWELTTYLTTAVLYILLKGFTWRQRRRRPTFVWSQTQQRLREEDENFCFAWGILFLLRIYGTVRFFLSTYPQHDFLQDRSQVADDVLLCLQCYGASAQAFWNFILYCVCDRTVRNAACGRRRGYNELEGSVNSTTI